MMFSGRVKQGAWFATFYGLAELHVACLCLSIGASWAQQTAGTVYGRITDSRGQPQRVRVQLLADGDVPAGDAYTDSNGGFAFNALPNGDYFLVVEESGYRPVRQSIVLDIGISPSVRINVVLEETSERPKGASPVVSHSPQSYKIDARDVGPTTDPKVLREFDRGNEKKQKGDLRGATEHYQKALRLEPDFYPALNNLGTVFMKQKDLAKAEAAFLKSMQINSRDGEAFINLGHVLYEKTKYKEAIERLQQGLDRSPDSAAGHFFLGSAYLHVGELARAEKDLKEAYALDPAAMLSARLQLASLYLKRHEMQAAAAELRSYLKNNPADPQAPAIKKLLAKIGPGQAN